MPRPKPVVDNLVFRTGRIDDSCTVIAVDEFKRKLIYWGSDANDAIDTGEEIVALNSEYSLDKMITKTFNPDNENGEYIYFAIPVAYGTPTFKYNNFTLTFMETIVPTDAFISEDYGVYRSNQLQHGQNLIFEMQ